MAHPSVRRLLPRSAKASSGKPHRSREKAGSTGKLRARRPQNSVLRRPSYAKFLDSQVLESIWESIVHLNLSQAKWPRGCQNGKFGHARETTSQPEKSSTQMVK